MSWRNVVRLWVIPLGAAPLLLSAWSVYDHRLAVEHRFALPVQFDRWRRGSVLVLAATRRCVLLVLGRCLQYVEDAREDDPGGFTALIADGRKVQNPQHRIGIVDRRWRGKPCCDGAVHVMVILDCLDHGQYQCPLVGRHQRVVIHHSIIPSSRSASRLRPCDRVRGSYEPTLKSVIRSSARSSTVEVSVIAVLGVGRYEDDISAGSAVEGEVRSSGRSAADLRADKSSARAVAVTVTAEHWCRSDISSGSAIEAVGVRDHPAVDFEDRCPANLDRTHVRTLSDDAGYVSCRLALAAVRANRHSMRTNGYRDHAMDCG